VRIWGKRLALLLCALLAAAGATALGGGTAYALGPGRVCMFNAPDAAGGAGHVGWAFEVGTSGQWVFGSTDDDPAGDPFVRPGDDNGAWTQSGDFTAARTAFQNSSIGYTRYRCKDTPTSAVGAAVQQADAAKSWGYSVVFNNCLDHAYNILDAYRGDVMPRPWLTILPDDHFVGGLTKYGWGPITPL
jgi:hypothetical protein